MIKTGDFREGDSREDLDMTKKANINLPSTLDTFKVNTQKIINSLPEKCPCSNCGCTNKKD